MMAILLVADVSFRLFLEPLQIIPELSVFAMVAVTYLGLSACEERGEHVRIQFVSERLSERFQILAGRASGMISAAAATVLFYAVLTNGLESFRTGEGTEGMITLQLWPVKMIMIIGAAVFVAESVRSLFRPLSPPKN